MSVSSLKEKVHLQYLKIISNPNVTRISVIFTRNESCPFFVSFFLHRLHCPFQLSSWAHVFEIGHLCRPSRRATAAAVTAELYAIALPKSLRRPELAKASGVEDKKLFLYSFLQKSLKVTPHTSSTFRAQKEATFAPTSDKSASFMLPHR